MYTIYSSIDYNQYVTLSANLEELETIIKNYLNSFDYNIENSISKSDALIIDLIKNDNNSFSNISVQFDDNGGVKPTFSIYAMKTIDSENKRFYVKLKLVESS